MNSLLQRLFPFSKSVIALGMQEEEIKPVKLTNIYYSVTKSALGYSTYEIVFLKTSLGDER